MTNKPKILIYDYPPWYRIEVHGPDVKVFSDHPRSKGKELSQWSTADGYLLTKIKSKSKTIHSLVAEVALGPRPEGLVINHKDANKLNNHPSNLEYCTIAENIQHSIEHGMHVASDPTRMPTYKDGRTLGDKNAYKLAWYHANKERLKREGKGTWRKNQKF